MKTVNAADAKRAALAALDQHVDEISDGLLTEAELTGLRAAMGKLAGLADQMGITEKPVSQWSAQEMLRFLSIAVRAAVPLHLVQADSTIPF